MDSEVARIIESEFYQKMFFDYEEEVTSNDGDIWLKSLDPLELLKHRWLLKKYDKPPMMMLIQSHSVDIGTEVGFRLQGILVDMKLPPVHVLEKNIHGIGQYVTITGLDQVVFMKNLMDIYALHDIYAKPLKDGVVDISHGDAVAISELVDPLGLLGKCNNQLIYTRSNVVNYYKRSMSTDGRNTEYEEIDPAVFHLGHIVELQVAFYLRLSNAKGRWFSNPTLCSISVIDTSIDQALLKIKMGKGDYHKPNIIPPRGLKRVSGIRTIDDKQTELARREMHKMALDRMASDSELECTSTSMEVDSSSKTPRAEYERMEIAPNYLMMDRVSAYPNKYMNDNMNNQFRYLPTIRIIVTMVHNYVFME
ncbi:hypothetical protein K439DRAFT_1624286 [Ramaria rubella]|nr:hypothetical protein K439DRAFT_1624286 [Ramaria rubella]